MRIPRSSNCTFYRAVGLVDFGDLLDPLPRLVYIYLISLSYDLIFELFDLQYNMMGESSELFVNCLEAMVETCLPGDESAPVPPSPRPYNLSSSLSSLTLGSPTDKGM